MKHLVIARYRENLEWLMPLFSMTETCPLRIFIYDKGGDGHVERLIQGYKNVTTEGRPNVGREAETYLYHICKHYSELPEYTLFLQGRPFDHCTHKAHEETIKEIQKETHERSQSFLGYRHEEPIGTYQICMREYYQHLFGTPFVDHRIVFAPGAQYIVKEEDIRRHPLEFYHRLQQMLERNPFISEHEQRTRPLDMTIMDAWTQERLWCYIWNITL